MSIRAQRSIVADVVGATHVPSAVRDGLGAPVPVSVQVSPMLRCRPQPLPIVTHQAMHNHSIVGTRSDGVHEHRHQPLELCFSVPLGKGEQHALYRIGR